VTRSSFAGHSPISALGMTYDDDRGFTWESCPLSMAHPPVAMPNSLPHVPDCRGSSPSCPAIRGPCGDTLRHLLQNGPRLQLLQFKEVSTQRLDAIKWMLVAFFQGHAVHCCIGARR
jgi:hypothetical protein